ncbi:helix-turn-helix transcriptional regulator [Brevibacillus agri]|uniref:helix-turn-helix domain-containing protein n=1 Tax=Brevibacillus agri TaxID=51101 RepID=UPI003D204BB3
MVKSNLPLLMAKHRIRTVAELSERTGISRATLTAIYYGKGKGVQYQTLETLCKLFKVGVGDILEFVDMEKTA